MDLNDFIFRDDTAAALGAAPEADDDVAEEAHAAFSQAKLGLAVIGSAAVGLSHLLAQAAKGL
jgi:hypothetical protein